MPKISDLEKLMGQTSVKKGSPTLNTQIQKFLQQQPLKQDPLKRQSQAADRRLKKGVAALMPGESLRELANRERQGLFRTTRAGDSPYLAPTPAGMTEKDWRYDPALKKKPPAVYESKKIEQRTYALESIFADVIDQVKGVRGEEGLNLELLERIGEKVALQSARMFTRANTTAYGFDAYSEYLSGKKGTKSFVRNFKKFLSKQGLPEKTAEVLAAGFVGAAKLVYEGKFETGRQQLDVGRARISGEAGANINTEAYHAAIDVRDLMDIAGGRLNAEVQLSSDKYRPFDWDIGTSWQHPEGEITAEAAGNLERIRQLELGASYRDQGVDVSGRVRTDPSNLKYTQAEIEAALNLGEYGKAYAKASGPLSNIQRDRWEAGVQNIPLGERGYVSPYVKGRGSDVQQLGLTAGLDLEEYGEFSGTGSITPEGEGQARLGYKATWKKGGKVTKKRKKRKTKKYTKGCAVRTAKY